MRGGGFCQERMACFPRIPSSPAQKCKSPYPRRSTVLELVRAAELGGPWRGLTANGWRGADGSGLQGRMWMEAWHDKVCQMEGGGRRDRQGGKERGRVIDE